MSDRMADAAQRKVGAPLREKSEKLMLTRERDPWIVKRPRTAPGYRVFLARRAKPGRGIAKRGVTTGGRGNRSSLLHRANRVRRCRLGELVFAEDSGLPYEIGQSLDPGLAYSCTVRECMCAIVCSVLT